MDKASYERRQDEIILRKNKRIEMLERKQEENRKTQEKLEQAADLAFDQSRQEISNGFGKGFTTGSSLPDLRVNAWK